LYGEFSSEIFQYGNALVIFSLLFIVEGGECNERSCNV
jgi:hypothetical protein